MNAAQLKTMLAIADKAVVHHDESPVRHDLTALANQAAPLADPSFLEKLFNNPMIAAAIQALIMAEIAKLTAPKPAPAPPVVVPPPAPPAPPVVTAPPAEPGLVFPDEVELVSVDGSHPTHGNFACEIEDGVVKPASTGTTDFDDNTDFVLHIGYKRAGVGIDFDVTPNASHLAKTSRFEFRVGGRPGVAKLSASECKGAGFMADGGQIRKRYDETRGMDPTVKFPPSPKGPHGGEVLTLDIFAPDGEGDEVGRRYTFAPYR